MISWLLLVVLLFVLGLLLIALEVWIIPGFGAVGVLGAAALLGAAAVAWFKLGLLQGVIALAASVGTMAALALWLPRSRTARAMVLQPRFVVLDEPTSALDMSVQAQVVDLLGSLQRKHDLTYLFISHDLKVVRALANELVVMRDGLVVERGPAASVSANPQADYTRALIASALALEPAPEGVVHQ